jgi:predicted histone-like DNA-binding protein
MTIKYKSQKRTSPQNRDNSKYYPSKVKSGTKDLENIIPAIEKMSTVSGADTAAVLYALLDVVPEMMADGYSVQLGNLGTMRVSIGGEGKDTADELMASDITKRKVIFTPGKKLKNMLDELTFEKVEK